MVTIDQIDFGKLRPYDGKVAKCFEQLWYQIARIQYSHLGTFTAIDGSGGDGGVEFYLKLSNGEKWGWQCKFFGDTGRLNVGSREKSIEGSLVTACRSHQDLTKWTLCLKTELTTESLSASGKFSQGEKNWFEAVLPANVPAGRVISLEHNGPNSLLEVLRDPKSIGIKSFFFGECELDESWFKKKFDENIERLKDKFDPDLHTISKEEQSVIDFLLFDPAYSVHLKTLKSELLAKSDGIQKALTGFKEIRTNATDAIKRDNFHLNATEIVNHFGLVFNKITDIEEAFELQDRLKLDSFSLQDLTMDFSRILQKIDVRPLDKIYKLSTDSEAIVELISDFGDHYYNFFSNYFHSIAGEMHFVGDAAKGKTHLSCDVAFKAIARKRPALLLTANKFSDETSITDALKKILDLPAQWSIDEFLAGVDTYGEITKTRVPIILDGLNETTFNRYFSPIWKNHLDSFRSKLASFRNLVFITTARLSYVPRIWNKYDKKMFRRLQGFNTYSTVSEAVTKYFSKYKLDSTLSFASLENFRDPIFLRIYCEIKNPLWRTSSVKVKVDLETESIFDVLNEYLRQVNQRITLDNHLFAMGENFVLPSLANLANYLWKNDRRDIPLADFYKLIDGNKLYSKDASRAEVLIHEGLVFTRDTNQTHEFVRFTYDILAGYLVAQELIDQSSSPKYFLSFRFIRKISGERDQHPLFDDVMSSLVHLLPAIKGATLHQLLDKSPLFRMMNSGFYKKNLPHWLKSVLARTERFYTYAIRLSISALYSLEGKYLKKEDVELIKRRFNVSEENKGTIFHLSLRVLSNTRHPLNSIFLYGLLEPLTVAKRDMNWTEFIRKKYNDLIPWIDEFERLCANSENESKEIIQRLHVLSRFIVWLLTSTNRHLRDVATRALYFYGRKFPDDYSELVYNSLRVNDPYVWERMLAGLYGVTMAEHNSFKSSEFRERKLPQIARRLYDLMFREGAQHGTTHILARDYARRTIKIAVEHHPTLLTNAELINSRPPFQFGGNRNPRERQYEGPDGYSGPIQMDFSNYTLGRIVKDGSSYADPPKKQQLRRQIYYRIYDELGWSEALFNETERRVTNDGYYGGRGERPKVERYGKKYSWIGYYEAAGRQADDGVPSDDERFRLPDADIDPSFPVSTAKKFIDDDFLGDRALSLQDWFKTEDFPPIEKYLMQTDPDGNKGVWVCLDGFVCQEDLEVNRRRFTFVRPFLLKEEEYAETVALLKNHQFEGRRIPEKNGNYYVYAGEMYNEDATEDNLEEFSFDTGTTKVTVRPGQAEYYALLFSHKHKSPLEEDEVDGEGDGNVGEGENENDFPSSLEYETRVTETRVVLMPAAEYNWESYHSVTNDAGSQTVVSKELAIHLELIDQPQTFQLFDKTGAAASLNFNQYKDYNNNQDLLYLRKDLLDKFLADKKMKFVWTVWGEREVSFDVEEKRDAFFKEHPFDKRQVFQKIIEYPLV